MFTHTSSLYDVLKQPQIQVTSSSSSCFLFSDIDIREDIWAISSNKETNGFQVEFFKHGLHALVSRLVDLFNHVVHTSFPSAWSHHIIHPIHKSGSNSEPNNYRTIMVGHTISKLYAAVLHLKLSKEPKWRQLRARGQARFRPKHQTIDHILTLKAIIEEARHRYLEVTVVL